MGFVSKSGLVNNTATQNKENVTPNHPGAESSRTAFDREIEVLEKGDELANKLQSLNNTLEGTVTKVNEALNGATKVTVKVDSADMTELETKRNSIVQKTKDMLDSADATAKNISDMKTGIINGVVAGIKSKVEAEVCSPITTTTAAAIDSMKEENGKLRSPVHQELEELKGWLNRYWMWFIGGWVLFIISAALNFYQLSLREKPYNTAYDDGVRAAREELIQDIAKKTETIRKSAYDEGYAKAKSDLQKNRKEAEMFYSIYKEYVEERHGSDFTRWLNKNMHPNR